MTDPIYALEPNLTALEFQQLLVDSGLAARRPADDLVRCMEIHAAIFLQVRRQGLGDFPVDLDPH